MKLKAVSYPALPGRRMKRKSITSLAVAACLGFAPATGRAASEDKKKMTDQAITNAVEHMLSTDSALLNNQLPR